MSTFSLFGSRPFRVIATLDYRERGQELMPPFWVQATDPHDAALQAHRLLARVGATYYATLDEEISQSVWDIEDGCAVRGRFRY